MLSSPASASSGRGVAIVGVAIVGVAVAASAVVALLPTLALQLAIVLGAAVGMAAFALAQAGRLLDPVWVIMGWIYLIGPLGSLLSTVGIGLSAVAIVLLAPSPFVVVALLVRPERSRRLVLLGPLLLLVGLAVLSTSWSPEPSYGMDKLSLWVITGLLPAAFILLLAPETPKISWGVIAGAALLYALALIAFGAATALNTGRMTIFDANPIWAARAVFIGALVVLFGPFPPVAKLIATPVMVYAGLTTVSSGPVVGLLIGAAAGAIEALRCTDRSNRRVALGWSAVIVLTGLAVVVALSGVLDPVLSSVANDPNTTARAAYLKSAGELAAGTPLFGIGIGGFASTGLALYPHNLIAEVGSELGLVGIALLATWIAIALRGAARSPLLVAVVFATGTFALFSGSIAGNNEFWMFSALAAAMHPAIRLARMKPKPLARAAQPLGRGA